MFVVKQDYGCDIDIRRAATHDPSVTEEIRSEWSTLGQRLKWVIQHRRGVVSSAEDWIRKASAVSGVKISRQLISSATGRDGSMRLDYAAMLVKVPGINVDLYWLATGEGDPSTGTKSIADPWHERRRGAQLAMEKHGVPFETIDAVRRDPKWNKEALRDKRASFWKNVFIEADHARLRLVQTDENAHADGAAERAG